MTSSIEYHLFHSEQLYNWIIEQDVPQHIIDQSIQQLSILRERFIEAQKIHPTFEQMSQDIASEYYNIDTHKIKQRIQIGQHVEQLGICIHHCSGISFGYSWVLWEKLYQLEEQTSIVLFTLIREIMSRIGLITIIHPMSSKRLFWIEFEICHLLLSQILPMIQIEGNSISIRATIPEQNKKSILSSFYWIQACPSTDCMSSEQEYLTFLESWYQTTSIQKSHKETLDQLGFWVQSEEIWVSWSSFVGTVFGEVGGYMVRECIWDILERHQKAAQKRLRWDQIKKIDIMYTSLYPYQHPLQLAEMNLLKSDIIQLIVFHQTKFRHQIHDKHQDTNPFDNTEATKYLSDKIRFTPQNHPKTWSAMLRSFPKSFRKISPQEIPILRGYQRIYGFLSAFQFRTHSEQYHSLFEIGRDMIRDIQSSLKGRQECASLLQQKKTAFHVQEAILYLPTEIQLYTTRGGRWPSLKL